MLESVKQREDNTQRSKQAKRTFRTRRRTGLLRRKPFEKAEDNLLRGYIGRVRYSDCVIAARHGWFGQTSELWRSPVKPFENSLLNSTALRPAIQNL